MNKKRSKTTGVVVSLNLYMAEPDILNPKVAVRQAANELSIGGGQGMVKCSCNGQCMTNRCGCKKSQLLCYSRCNGASQEQINFFQLPFFNQLINKFTPLKTKIQGLLLFEITSYHRSF
ncbi:KRAB-A domain-containing [Brachionus plicatilis]|uniref:KRAB-A domain-containing n=1 Tax=Brachionus plicatilis TaxID=10195 RepID=A0A3M7S4Y1_BRAPC|nr:KRAB-A domain-containing [Brachionus plicatilis]